MLRVGWWWFGSTAIEIANEYHAVFPTLSPIGFGPGTVCKSFRPEGLDGTRRVIYVYFSEHSHGISKQPIAQGNLPNLYFWVAMQVISMLLCRSNSPISFNEADIKRDPTRCGEIQYLSRITHTKQAIPRLSRIFLVPVEKPMEIDHSCIKAAPADSSKTCSKCVFSAKQVSFQASERLTKLNSKKYKQSRKQVNEEDIWTCRVLLSIHYWMMMWHILPSFRSW